MLHRAISKHRQSLVLPKPGCKANNCCAIKVSDKPGGSASEAPGASGCSGITWTHWILLRRYRDLGVLRPEVNVALPSSRNYSRSVWTEGQAGGNGTHFRKPRTLLQKTSGKRKIHSVPPKKKNTQPLAGLKTCILFPVKCFPHLALQPPSCAVAAPRGQESCCPAARRLAPGWVPAAPRHPNLPLPANEQTSTFGQLKKKK